MNSVLSRPDLHTPDLHTIAYFSWSAIHETNGDVGTEVARILAASRRNNPSRGITGALLFSQGCFAQVLEGPRAAVEACFERLKGDPRHRGLIQVMSTPLAQRRFGAWTMAYAGEDNAPGQSLDIAGSLANYKDIDGDAAGQDLIETLAATISLHEPA